MTDEAKPKDKPSGAEKFAVCCVLLGWLFAGEGMLIAVGFGAAMATWAVLAMIGGMWALTISFIEDLRK